MKTSEFQKLIAARKSNNGLEFNEYRAQSVLFYANTQNGRPAPKATELKQWAISNGLSFTEKPAAKSSVRRSFFDGKNQDVTHQIMAYTIK